jgi:hypothetical protein
MFYIIIGIFIGIILNFIPVINPMGAVEIYPEWNSSINSIENIQYSSNQTLNVKFPISTETGIYLLSSDGRLLKKKNLDTSLVSVSGNGEYCAQYEKASAHVEFLNISGEKFWRINSMEYPHISTSGKLILFINGDHSRIRLFDINGNPVGVKEIQGITCLNIAFSKHTNVKTSDFSGIGFLDGSYYFLNDKGEILENGKSPKNSPIKGLAISSNGQFCIIHFGNGKDDFLKLIEPGKKSYIIPLKHIHLTKTAITVNDEGNIAAIDYDRIIITKKNKIKTIIKIPPKSPGLASIDFSGGLYSASYAGINGRTNFIIFAYDGTILFNRTFNEEVYLESVMNDNIILLRGMTNLFCYSFQIPEDH